MKIWIKKTKKKFIVNYEWNYYLWASKEMKMKCEGEKNVEVKKIRNSMFSHLPKMKQPQGNNERTLTRKKYI